MASAKMSKRCDDTGMVKGTWTEVEDNLLREQLKLRDNMDTNLSGWGDIAAHIRGRTAKQCRERWVQNLKPNLRRDAIQGAELRFVEDWVARNGTRWAELSREMEARGMGLRSDNQLKNTYNGVHNRKRNNLRRGSAHRHSTSPVHSRPTTAHGQYTPQHNQHNQHSQHSQHISYTMPSPSQLPLPAPMQSHRSQDSFHSNTRTPSFGSARTPSFGSERRPSFGEDRHAYDGDRRAFYADHQRPSYFGGPTTPVIASASPSSLRDEYQTFTGFQGFQGFHPPPLRSAQYALPSHPAPECELGYHEHQLPRMEPSWSHESNSCIRLPSIQPKVEIGPALTYDETVQRRKASIAHVRAMWQ